MSDLRVLAAAVLLAAGVAAAVSAATIRFGGDPAPRIAPAIATVRLGQLTADYAVRAAGSGASAEASAVWTRGLGGGAGERARCRLAAPPGGAFFRPARSPPARPISPTRSRRRWRLP